MNNTTIKQDIITFLSQYSGDREFSDNEPVFGRGLINSLFAMQLVLHLEKKYQFKVENQDLDLKNFQSINAITNFVQSKLSQQTV